MAAFAQKADDNEAQSLHVRQLVTPDLQASGLRHKLL
jgi:hypothetical protein